MYEILDYYSGEYQNSNLLERDAIYSGTQRYTYKFICHISEDHSFNMDYCSSSKPTVEFKTPEYANIQILCC
jgi:hypothetical protein